MPVSHNGLQISPRETATAALTPQQKRFNSLIGQIDRARQTLAAWQAGIDAYRQGAAQVLRPLEAELRAAHREWAFALDRLADARDWTAAETETLSELVRDAAGGLLHARDGDDAELEALFAKHAGVDFEAEHQQMVLAVKEMAEAMTGLDLGDDEGIASHDDLLQRMHKGLQERMAAEAVEPGATGRRKSAAQQRREAEAQEATQSVREVFRKLASALHPDREPDARQREAKTALMQKANQAYADNDLLALLELQLQIEQIDAGHIANASAQKLKHYNKVLSDQLRELKAEIEHVELGFEIEFGLDDERGVNPRQLGRHLEQSARNLRAELNRQQREMRMLADVNATKRWLKRQRKLLREADEEFDLGLFPDFRPGF